MISSKVTPPVEEEGAEVEGTTEATGSEDFTHGRFGQRWASLCPNRINIYGTNGGVVKRVRNEDGKMAKDSRDKLIFASAITGRRIMIHIKDRSDEMKGEVNRKILNEGQKKASTRLNDRVIVRQRSKSECHHHVKESQTFCIARAWGILLPTPYGRCLIEVRQKLICGYSLKTLITGVIRM